MSTIEEVMAKKNLGVDDPSAFEKKYIDDLKTLVIFLENNPHLIPRYSGLSINIFADDIDEMVALATGGMWSKDSTDAFYFLAKEFGEHKISINTGRSAVCEKVIVGDETVEITDPDAPKIKVTRPIYEWKCPEHILGGVNV